MTRRRLLSCGLLWIAAVACAPSAWAEPFWRRLPFVPRVEADPEKSYVLTENQGPWLVLATTFAGPSAEQDAKELALELRKSHNMPAYTHRMHFDFKDARARGVDQFGERRKAHYRTEEIHEIGVLVGDFPSVDDPKAQKTLQELKQMRPECLMSPEERAQAHPLAMFRGVWKTIQQQKGIKTVKVDHRPMATAMLTTNPLLPDEYYVPKGLDPFVADMNKNVEYSLLDCPHRYSVKVATFSGRVIVDQKKISEIQQGKEFSSQLEAAADKAHRLASTLREQGYEAYEFHDRGQSIVCVGSFESVGTPRADGRTELNPGIHTIMTTFGADKQFLPGQAVPQVGMPKVFGGVACDIQPMPVEVPRKSIGREYADRGGFFGKF